MNGSVSPLQRQAIETVTLDDRYTLATGRAFMSGVQALVRLPMLQRMRDANAGHHTAAFISGYRGSPLGGYDLALWQASEHLANHHVVFKPGVNEELGVTAVWGSQQLEFDAASKKYDGVFGIWYGKGPGVDRSGDALKHANLAGTAPLGGVIAVAGDDHVSKSSTLAHQSDHTFMACGLPGFFPASVQDILDLGVHAFAMSRFSGLWAGMKTVQEVVESGASVLTGADRVRIVLPEDCAMPEGGIHIRWPDDPLGAEARMMEFKWPAALAYVRANRLNHDVVASQNDRLGIIASGKAYGDTRQALLDLGLDDTVCRALGIRVHKVSVVWPLEPASVRGFAHGLREILVVEEKRPIIEQQLKDDLYHFPPQNRPPVFGKYGHTEGVGGEWSHGRPADSWLLRAKADLSPALVAQAIAQRLKLLGVPPDVAARMDMRLMAIEARQQQSAAQGDSRSTDRLPWFCPGCPHNTSTRVPEGSIAMAGIGCHGMVTWMDPPTPSSTHNGRARPPPIRPPAPLVDADGRRGRALDRPGALQQAQAHVRQSGRRHIPPLGPARSAPVDRCRRQPDLQDSLQQRRRHDRRPSGGRWPARRAGHVARTGGRGRAPDRRGDRRAGQVPGRHRSGAGRDHPAPRRARHRATRTARGGRRHRDHLRPGLRDQETP